MAAWASLISEMEAMAEEHRRQKRMFADVSKQKDFLKEASAKDELASPTPRVGRK